jgi:hypothetical protein
LNKISRPLLFTFLAIVILAALGSIIASSQFSSGHGPTLVMFDEDLSDSALGWALAIPIMAFVGVVVTAVLAGAALITVAALAFTAVIVVLVMLLAFTPIVVFLGLPILAVYGLFKLIQRDQRQIKSAA